MLYEIGLSQIIKELESKVMRFEKIYHKNFQSHPKNYTFAIFFN